MHVPFMEKVREGFKIINLRMIMQITAISGEGAHDFFSAIFR